MKYTIEIQYVKPKEAESLATVTAKNTEGIIVSYSDILLSINPKTATTWQAYEQSGLNALNFTGAITIDQALQNSAQLRMSLDEYTKRLTSYYNDVVFNASATTEINS